MEEQLNADMIKNVKNKLHVWGREKMGMKKTTEKKRKDDWKYIWNNIYIFNIYTYISIRKTWGGEWGREREWIQSERKIYIYIFIFTNANIKIIILY